jgi:hypothetical protein
LFLLLSLPQLTLLPLQLPLPTQLVPPLPPALPLLLPLTPLHPLPATQKSNHFVIHEKAASGRLFCVCCYLVVWLFGCWRSYGP